MKVTAIEVNWSLCAAGLQERLAFQPRATIFAFGNLDLLQSRLTALFCSAQCPPHVILQTHAIARALRDAGFSVVGGFHSPLEKECLSLLLRGAQPILICPARNIEGMRLPAAWKRPLDEGRLLVLSGFERRHRRITLETALTRNAFVAGLADQVFVAHARPGSRTYGFCRDLLARNKPLWTVASDENSELIELGARPLMADLRAFASFLVRDEDSQ